jgi:hypothetical protein
MSIELNHIIIPARSKWVSATFLASILDVPAGSQRGPFGSRVATIRTLVVPIGIPPQSRGD